MTTPVRTSHRVVALDPAVRDALATAVHMLRHDLSNALVAAMGGLELEALDADPALAERLWAIRASLHRPFDALRRATLTLPLPQGQPAPWAQRWSALVVRAQTLHVALVWSPDEPLAWNAAPWQTLVAEALLTNALDAVEGQPQVAPEVVVVAEPGLLVVSDNGPGCDDIAAAASGRLRRSGSGHLGQGLAVAASLLAAVGGDLTVSQELGRGWMATAKWPT